ncbi:translation initiation factor IF-2 [Buchnera aphidicola]|uniref:translation initiation factor IF-2 n=1 Tax=Buchnera aphidicola TaxID=9 RepID=UPI002237683B|nr:translation initiation factor IF-2 [Buchnera aphidicola]MCW5197582.1 translation initiation factor IF-2 [Buchnera aphidicola (Chaitophorus viminalis)]
MRKKDLKKDIKKNIYNMDQKNSFKKKKSAFNKFFKNSKKKNKHNLNKKNIQSKNFSLKKNVYPKDSISNIKKKNVKNFKTILNKNNKLKKNSIKKKKYYKNSIRFKKNIKYLRKNINKNFLKQAFHKPKNVINKKITIFDQITVLELSNKMGIKSSVLIQKMFHAGINLSINQSLKLDLAQLISEEMGFQVKLIHKNFLEESIMKDRNFNLSQKKNLRPPIVTVMGHVDHGKTSLLDCIRKTSTVLKEKGGITQSIGAYHVKINNKRITFLDTPGHAAFTSMRARGAQITDIVVLIVAADDGVMPQTIEAIQHAQFAKVPIIVAINKIDKNNINIEKINNELMKYNILSEELGGENIFVKISVKLNKGIKNLLNSILLQSEMLELSTYSKGMATGIVIESFLEKGRGIVSTIIVKEGELKKGDIVLCGLEYGKIKSIKNEHQKDLLKVGPSIPVEILGLSGLPFAGDILTVVRSEKKAKEVALYRKEKYKQKFFSKQKKINLENLFDNINKKNISELNIILKSNSKGSLEAISSAIKKLSHKEVNINIISANVGRINETDAYLANTSNSIIIGFNVRADISAKKIIKKENLDLRYYSVIYNLINEIKSSIYGMLSPKYKQEVLGLAEVRSIFKSPKFGFIAGCMVIEGIIKRNHPIRILRDHLVIYEGELESIRRFKEDVKKVRHGTECGIGIKNYNDIKVNDIIEVYKIKKIKRL